MQEYAYDGAEDLPEDGMYDDEAHDDDFDDELDEDELSSSPSIPDENINFDLVYALHTFVATVEGQATVHKGENLILLDDSNSYWWLVRVMTSQEVGYIPAENIETPYERLARLNKHRNVEITTATENDHDQVPRNIYSGHLVKARQRGVDAQSGKPSALSRREINARNAPKVAEKKRGVIFGQSEYLEHSGDEVSFEGEYDEDNEEEYGEEEPEDEEDADHDMTVSQEGPRSHGAGIAAATAGVAAAAGASGEAASSGSPGSRPVLGIFDPDDSLVRDLPSENEPHRQRPGSLLGVPGSGPTFNVVRVFAGDNVESTATFKTALLSKTTKAADLVRQAMQRFRVEADPTDYAIVLKQVDGEEQVLWADDYPLDILESLSEDDDAESKRQSRDSVGSLSSLIDSSSNKVAFDYSDDRFGKLYLVHTASYTLATEEGVLAETHQGDRLAVPAQGEPPSSPGPSMRFTLQLALFPRDLPDGKIFHPKTGVAVPGDTSSVRMDRPETRLLNFAKNATVAEVIESALSHFQVFEGVVDGGDEVEERMPNARGRSRVKYSLSVVTDAGEQGLSASTKVLQSYDTPPLFKSVDPESMKALKRGSLEMQQVLGAPEDISDTDPLFVLRQARTLQARSLPGMGVEPQTKAPTPERAPPTTETLSPVRAPAQPASPSAARVASPPFSAGSPGRTPPRPSGPVTPAHTTATVLPDSPTPTRGSTLPLADTNDQQGVDLIVNEKVRLRSARTNDSPRIRYSLLQNGDEQDVSSALRDVLSNKEGTPRDVQSPASHSGDLLEKFVGRMPDMSNNSVADTIDLMIDRINHIPENRHDMDKLRHDVGGDTKPLFSSRDAPDSGSTVSTQSSVSPAVRKPQISRYVPLDAFEPAIRTNVDLNALYGIVGAMAMVPTKTPISREHRRVQSTSSTISSHGWLQQSSSQLAKLLDDPEEVKVLEATNGLVGPDLPRGNHEPGSDIAAVQEKYAPLMTQVSTIEQSLDDALRAVLNIDS